MHQGYDLIGDIHGCGNTLIELLEQLGYSKRNGIYQHPKIPHLVNCPILETSYGPQIELSENRMGAR